MLRASFIGTFVMLLAWGQGTQAQEAQASPQSPAPLAPLLAIAPLAAPKAAPAGEPPLFHLAPAAIAQPAPAPAPAAPVATVMVVPATTPTTIVLRPGPLRHGLANLGRAMAKLDQTTSILSIQRTRVATPTTVVTPAVVAPAPVPAAQFFQLVPATAPATTMSPFLTPRFAEAAPPMPSAQTSR
jgi:hypothetical protein